MSSSGRAEHRQTYNVLRSDHSTPDTTMSRPTFNQIDAMLKKVRAAKGNKRNREIELSMQCQTEARVQLSGEGKPSSRNASEQNS